MVVTEEWFILTTLSVYTGWLVRFHSQHSYYIMYTDRQTDSIKYWVILLVNWQQYKLLFIQQLDHVNTGSVKCESVHGYTQFRGKRKSYKQDILFNHNQLVPNMPRAYIYAIENTGKPAIKFSLNLHKVQVYFSEELNVNM